MRTKFITSFMLALVCGLPITAKVYTIQSLLGDLVVNVHVDKSITWAVTKGKLRCCSHQLSPYRLISKLLV